MQSQEFGPALWSVRQRLTSGSEQDLLAAFDAGTLLRTHVLRPTWHFVLPEDIQWLLELTAPRVHAFNAYYYRQHQLDEHVLGTCLDAIGATLADGNALTRKEVAATLADAGVVAEGLRLGLILMYAELERVICSGPRRGKQHTYALLEERARQARRLSRDVALAELTLRYFISRGPATVKDFAWWSGLTVADIQAGLGTVSGSLESFVVDDVTYWHGEPEAALGPEKHELSGPAWPRVLLLQPYDEYAISYSESRSIIDRSGFGALRPEGRGAYVGLVILDTQLVGFWRRTVQRRQVIIDTQLYRSFGVAEMDALRSSADAHAAFLGKEAVVNPPEPVPGVTLE